MYPELVLMIILHEEVLKCIFVRLQLILKLLCNLYITVSIFILEILCLILNFLEPGTVLCSEKSNNTRVYMPDMGSNTFIVFKYKYKYFVCLQIQIQIQILLMLLYFK